MEGQNIPAKSNFLASLSDKEREQIAKKAGEAKRRNNAIADRFSKALFYRLAKQNQIKDITDTLVEQASDPTSRYYMDAVNLIMLLTGIKNGALAEQQEILQQNQPQIQGQNVQIIFASDVGKLAK